MSKTPSSSSLEFEASSLDLKYHSDEPLILSLSTEVINTGRPGQGRGVLYLGIDCMKRAQSMVEGPSTVQIL